MDIVGKLRSAADGVRDAADLLDEAANEIVSLREQLQEEEKQAARAIEQAKSDAYAEAEREMRREYRGRDEWSV